MRKIKFKGMKNSTKEWVHGSLITDKKRGYAIVQITDNPISKGIVNGWCFGIEKGTECQYTGLVDINGKEIYEGGILGEYGKDHPLGEYKATVIWNTKKAEWYLDKAYCSGQRNLWRWCDKMEIIGNIYENPELI